MPAAMALESRRKKMRERGREFVTANEPTLVAEPSFDEIVVDDG